MYAVQTSLDGERVPAAGVEYVIPCRRNPAADEFDYGDGLALAWVARPATREAGMLVIEHDVVVDPDDRTRMEWAIAEDTLDVVAAAYTCWPKSTGLCHPMTLPRFNHGVHMFGLGCTWLPARLIDHVWHDLPRTAWNGLDGLFSRAAMELGLVVRTPHGVNVKHTHY